MTLINSNKDMALILSKLPYRVIVFRDDITDPVTLDDKVWIAYHPELQGCIMQGETREEAIQLLDEARLDYMEHFLDHDLDIPLPDIPYGEDDKNAIG